MSNNCCLLAAGKIRKFKSGQTVLTARIIQGGRVRIIEINNPAPKKIA